MDNIQKFLDLSLHCFLILMFASCTSYKVVTFTNSKSSFSDYYSYTLEHLKTKVDQEGRKKPEVVLRLEEAMHLQMDDRKYLQSSKPDMILRYEIISNQRTEYDMNTRAFRPSIYNSYGYYYDLNERNFTESILLLELKDAQANKIVWQGSLDLRYSRKSKKTNDMIQDAVIKIFESYRYSAGSNVPLAPESEG